MKAVCKLEALQKVIGLVGSVVPARSTQPALQNLLLSVGKETLTASATDLDVGLCVEVPVEKGSEPGQVGLRGADFSAIVREADAEEIKIEATGEAAKVRAGGASYNLVAYAGEDFPAVADFPASAAAKLTGVELAETIDRVLFAAAREQTRYAINGIYLALRKKELEMVATDAHRLAVVRRKLGKAAKDERSAIAPLKVMGEIRKIIESQKPETVEIAFTDREIFFRVPDVVLVGRLVEGNYPKYEEAIPDDCDRKVTFDRELMLKRLRQAMLLTSEESRSVTLTFEKGKATIRGRTPERGEARVELEVDYPEKKVEVAFNPQYLVDVLRVLRGEGVTLLLKDASRPGLVREGKDYLYVLMPVRVREV